MIAGTLATMAVSSGEMSQFASWAAAIIVGGGTAGVVQMSTVAARGVSTATTGGLGNFIVATGEWIGAILLSVSAMLVPALVAIVVLIAVIWVVRWIRHKSKNRRIPRYRCVQISILISIKSPTSCRAFLYLVIR